MSNEKYKTDLTKTKYVNDSKITDHYAIIPTGQGYENYDQLPELQKNVYKVIVKRFLAIFFPPAEYNKISATISIENEQFIASGKVCIKLGYLEVLKDRKDSKIEEKNVEDVESEPKKSEDTGDNTNLEILNSLKKGEEVGIVNFEKLLKHLHHLDIIQDL